MKFLPSPRQVRRHPRGFTLIEMLVTIVVLAILLALAVPSFGRMLASNRLSTQTNEFVATMNLARVEAARRVQQVSLRTDGNTIEYANGWSIFTDSNGDGDKGSTDNDGTVIRVGGMLSGRTSIKRVTAAFADYTGTDKLYLVFNERGALRAGTAAAFFKVCDTGFSSVPGRVIQVSLIGKVSVINSAATCP